jgi:hypothetical protein
MARRAANLGGQPCLPCFLHHLLAAHLRHHENVVTHTGYYGHRLKVLVAPRRAATSREPAGAGGAGADQPFRRGTTATHRAGACERNAASRVDGEAGADHPSLPKAAGGE